MTTLTISHADWELLEAVPPGSATFLPLSATEFRISVPLGDRSALFTVFGSFTDPAGMSVSTWLAAVSGVVTSLTMSIDGVEQLNATGMAVSVSEVIDDAIEKIHDVVELAIGDQATIIGSDDDDHVSGNGGDDSIYGGHGNDDLYGDLGDDSIGGGSGDDTLRGGGGDDSISGGNGDDRIYGGGGRDRLHGGGLDDFLAGGGGNDRIIGGAGRDRLVGNSGADVLVGAAGKDTLSGGLGDDIFRFNTITETRATAGTCDVITDFVRGDDRVNLAPIDADKTVAGNQAFTELAVGGAFSDTFSAPGQLYFDRDAHVLYGNNDADDSADFAIKLTGITALSESDLIM